MILLSLLLLFSIASAADVTQDAHDKTVEFMTRQVEAEAYAQSLIKNSVTCLIRIQADEKFIESITKLIGILRDNNFITFDDLLTLEYSLAIIDSGYANGTRTNVKSLIAIENYLNHN